VPQHALQLLGGQPAPEASPRVHLGALDERLAEALVQAGVVVIEGGADDLKSRAAALLSKA